MSVSAPFANDAPATPTSAAASPVALRERMAGSAATRRPNQHQLATAMLVGGAKLQKQQQLERRPASSMSSSRPGSSFVRSCCTPPVDASVERREAALEALLTAGDYEETFCGGRSYRSRNNAQQTPPSGGVATVNAAVADEAVNVRQLRGFDRQMKHARAAAKRAQAVAKAGGADLDTASPAEQHHHAASLAPSFAPPRVIQLVFRLGTVRNLPATQALRRIGYPELHEQFSVAASATGIIYKQQYLEVLGRYLTPHEHADSLRILECFGASAHGDVELPIFLVGLQLLLECATPGDTLRYCFQLLDSASAVPRYMTRFEAQTLVTYADESARIETRRVLAQQRMPAKAIEDLGPEELVQRCGDRSFLAMRRAILAIVDDTSRYDYCGRMPLSDFLAALEQEMARHGTPLATTQLASPPPAGTGDTPQAAGSPTKKKPTISAKVARGTKSMSAAGSAVLAAVSLSSGVPTSPKVSATPALSQAPAQGSPFVFGRAWQGGGALVHRLSSKKMIIASLTPQQQQQQQQQLSQSRPSGAQTAV